MHEYVDKRSMSEMLEHEFVFEVVENRLDERAFAQKNFLLERHQNIFHGAFYPRDYFQSPSHQTKKQIFADVTFVRKIPSCLLSFEALSTDRSHCLSLVLR